MPREFIYKYTKKTNTDNTPRFGGIQDIMEATREQNFVSPFIDTPEKVQIPDTKFVEDAPRKREPDEFTSRILKGLSTPVLSSYQELGQAGDELKKGEVGSGIADLLKGTLHTALTPITAPLGGISEVLKGTGEVGGEVAKGLEQTMNLPFDAIKQGSELVKQVVESTGLDISDSGTSKKFNDLAIEVGGLLAMGKGIREAKKYVETKVPEITVLPKDPEITIKSQETKPVEGLTQEKSVTDLIPKIEPEVVEAPKVQSKREAKTLIFEENKTAIKEILKDSILTPQQISRKLTSLKEQGKIKDKISIESIKLIADEIQANKTKRPIQEIKGAENELGIKLPNEMNSTRAVSFDRKSGLTVKEVLEQNPEFKDYVKDLTDIDEVTTQLNSLYWKKRHKEPLPEIPQEITPETSFGFGENKPAIETPIEETTSVKNEMMNKEREFRGLEPLETKDVRKQEPLIEDAKQKIESGEVDPNKLAQEILDNPRILTDGDVAVLQVNARRLKDESTKLVDDISKETDPNKTQELRVKALELEEQYNVNDMASKQTGTDTARALAIRRVELKDDYSIAPLKQKAKIANNNQPLPEEITIKLEQQSKQILEAETKLKEYQEQLSRVEAERVLQESIRQEKFQERTQKRETVKKDLDVEYQDLIKEFAKTQQFNVLVDPKQISIMVKAAKNRINKGITNIEQVVDQLYQDVKQYMPELTKKDIYDAIGGMGRFQKMTENDIKVELKDIRKQRSDESLQKAYKTRLETRKAELEKMLETGNFEKTPRRKTKMTPELNELKDRVDLLKMEADKEIRLLEEKNKTTEQKAVDMAEEITNIPRAMITSVDLSAPLRQGAVFSFSHPRITFGKDGAFRKMFDYFKDDKHLRELRREIEEDPNAVLHNKMGIYFANEKSNLHRIAGKEESYMTDLPGKIPVYGRLFKGSQRAYTGFLDKQRLDVANYYIDNLKKANQTFESNPKLYKDVGKFINVATGRGTLGGFERSASALSVGLFSPRLIASRLTLINPRYYLKLDPIARKLAMKDMLKFVGTGTTIASLASLMGAEVETDPRSTDFMKVKIGNTRLDVWGGFQQYGVFITRMATGQTKNAKDELTELNGEEYPFTNRWDLAVRFGEQKLSPFAGLIRDYFKGENFMGEEITITDELINSTVPLYMQDMYDAIKDEGVTGALKVAPGVFGVGTQTYKEKKPELKF